MHHIACACSKCHVPRIPYHVHVPCRAVPCYAVRPTPPRVLRAPPPTAVDDLCGDFWFCAEMEVEEAFMMLSLICLSSSTSMPIEASMPLDLLRSPMERALVRGRAGVRVRVTTHGARPG